MATLPPELRSAFVLFLKELKNHLKMIQERVAESDLTTAESFEPTRKALEHRFHTIRGGAGFFQLEQVLNSAAAGEIAMRKGREIAEYKAFLDLEIPETIAVIERALAENASAESV